MNHQRRIHAQKTLFEKAKADEQSVNEQLNWILKREKESHANYEAACKESQKANEKEAQIEEYSDMLKEIVPKINSIIAKEKEIQR